ncbi:hypothetical protein J4448_01020 [Candidatus Woesearchaeota archaeon]|nr:hypothetical protein [Candidatus Woesearchaeota archaeon]
MDDREKILRDNFDEYFHLALKVFDEQKYNSATTLFFKAIVALCDLFLLKRESRVPSSHSDRFRTIEEKYPELYKILDRDFPFYQDSYTKKMDKESAGLLKDDIGKIKKILEG